LCVIARCVVTTPYSGDIRQTPLRLSVPGAQLLPTFPELIHDAETRLVGQIIANKTGSRPANGASCINAAIASLY
jgi:hypothetical protein